MCGSSARASCGAFGSITAGAKPSRPPGVEVAVRSSALTKSSTSGQSRDTARAMSEENMKIALRGHDRFNAFMSGAISSDVYAEIFDPEVEVVWADQQTYPDFPQHLRGVAQVIAFAEQYRDGWAEAAAEPIE